MSHYEVQNLLLDIQLKTKLLEIRLSVTWELGPPVGPTLSCLFKNLTESVAVSRTSYSDVVVAATVKSCEPLSEATSVRCVW